MLPSDAECAQLDRLLEQVLDASPTEREALLSILREQQPTRHQELLQMLELAGQPCPALDPERIDRHAAWQLLGARPQVRPQLGERIGAWCLVRPLGRGGMGDVYEAARADGAYEQRAALKLILDDVIDSHDFLERFARERQILAELGHPGIARLLDGGEDARGRPFLVMELVSGSSIDQYCAVQRLDLRARLQLFLQVAAAVEHAHRHGVIHRDIKPSNIVVAAGGEAKLLDFGIAKVLAETASETTAARTTALLTPQYSTPEQVLGGAIDRRSDVYQLGLLLFELLSTQRAQEPIDGTPQALLESVCSSDRVPPSVSAARAPAAATRQIGGLDPKALAGKLHGDLDCIVLKALRHDAQRRYGSVQAFSDDVERYLRGEPVQARPETLTYRAGKFVRRHPWGVASTAAAFVLMAAYAVHATLLVRENIVQRDLAAAEARTAQQVKTLVLRMLEGANPEQALGRELTARELLDGSWPLIELQTADQPRVQLELLNTLGESYRQLGDYPQAQARLSDARKLITAHPQLPAELQAATLSTSGRLSTNQGDYAQAEQALLQARDLLRQRFGPLHVRSAEILEYLGNLEHMRARYAPAVAWYEQALSIREQLGSSDALASVDAMEGLAVTRMAQGEYTEAARRLEQAVAVQRQRLPAGHPHIATSLASLAEVRQRQGHSQQAATLYREALEIMQHSRGAAHPFVATIMNSLSRVLMDLQQLDAAEPLLRQALAIRRATLPPRDTQIAMNLSDLGALLESRGQPAQAESHYRQALELLGPDHAWRGIILNNVGRTCESRQAWREAEELYRESLQLNQRHFGADHDVVGVAFERLGTLLYARGRKAEAEAALREALRIFTKQLSATHPRIQDVSALLQRIAAERSR